MAMGVEFFVRTGPRKKLNFRTDESDEKFNTHGHYQSALERCRLIEIKSVCVHLYRWTSLDGQHFEGGTALLPSDRQRKWGRDAGTGGGGAGGAAAPVALY
jgi:hypothetical protein